jgi:ABC-type multidrug transport system fused ATPase/permease subunit
MKTIWRVAQYLFRYRLLYWLTIGFAVLSIVFTLAIPQAIEWLINGVANSQTTSLWLSAGMILGCSCG